MTPEMVEEIKASVWLCSACKRCIVCGDVRFEQDMLICDLCDRSFHMQVNDIFRTFNLMIC